jgi:hypothetical protein
MANQRATDTFLTTIDTRIAALQQLRASYLAAMAAGAIGPSEDLVPAPMAAAPPPPPAREEPPAPVRRAHGAISAEIVQILRDSPRPLKVRDLASALRQRGIASRASNIRSTVNSILHRMRQRGLAVRSAQGWTLTATGAGATTPARESLESSAAQASATTAALPTVTRLPARLPRRLRTPRPRPASSEPTADQRPGGLAWRIESLLKSHGKPVAARYVADATGEPLNVVGLALGRMVRQQRVEKQADGPFVTTAAIPATEIGNGEGHPADADTPALTPSQP